MSKTLTFWIFQSLLWFVMIVVWISTSRLGRDNIYDTLPFEVKQGFYGASGLMLVVGILGIPSILRARSLVSIAFVCLLSLIILGHLLLEPISISHLRIHVAALGAYLGAYYLFARDEKFLPPLGIIATAFAMLITVDLVAERARGGFTSEKQLHEAYLALGVLPLIIMCRNEVLRYIGMLLVALCAVLALKRGVVVAFGACLAAYFAVKNMSDNFGKRRMAWVLVVGILSPAVWLTLILAMDRLRGGGNLERFRSIGSDSGSGRVDLYLDIIDSITKFSLTEMAIGAGALSSVQAIYEIQFAVHCDWLQIMHEHGTVGVILMFTFFAATANLLYRSALNGSPHAAPLAAVFMLFLLTTVYSVGLYSPRFVLTALALGALVALNERWVVSRNAVDSSERGAVLALRTHEGQN